MAQLINNNNQVVAQLMNPNKLRDRKRKLCWKCCITLLRIQLLLHYNFLVLKSNGHIIKVNRCFQATISFTEPSAFKLRTYNYTSNLWVYVAYGMSPNAGGYPHQGHHNEEKRKWVDSSSLCASLWVLPHGQRWDTKNTVHIHPIFTLLTYM